MNVLIVKKNLVKFKNMLLKVTHNQLKRFLFCLMQGGGGRCT